MESSSVNIELRAEAKSGVVGIDSSGTQLSSFRFLGPMLLSNKERDCGEAPAVPVLEWNPSGWQ